MASRLKLPPKSKKVYKKRKAEQPVSSDDFQEAADLEEETGGKWRAGDPTKSSRAFVRAIQLYQDGLKRHPQDFNLAYNLARLQLDLAQQPALVSRLPLSATELLVQAVDSHMYALKLDAENPDALYNTAQAIITLTDELDEEEAAASISDMMGDRSTTEMLTQALSLLKTCLSIQAWRFEEQSQAESNPNDSQTGHDSQEDTTTSDAADDQEPEEDYVIVQQPVTVTDLIDTQRGIATVLQSLLQTVQGPNVQDVVVEANSVLEQIQSFLANLPSDQLPKEAATELAVEMQALRCAIAHGQFNLRSLTIEQYLEQLNAFQTFDLQTNFAAIVTFADSLIALSQDVVEQLESGTITEPNGQQQYSSTIWQSLSKAQSLYGTASKLSSSPELTPQRKASLYQSRGDVDMARLYACLPATPVILPDATVQNGPKLVVNAVVYYQAASSHFRQASEERGAAEAQVRWLVARVVSAETAGTNVADAEKALQELKHIGPLSDRVLRKMMEEGLIESEIYDKCFVKPMAQEQLQ